MQADCAVSPTALLVEESFGPGEDAVDMDYLVLVQELAAGKAQAVDAVEIAAALAASFPAASLLAERLSV